MMPRRFPFRALLASAMFAVAGPVASAAQEAFPLSDDLPWSDVRLLMAQHCFDCHGGFLTEGGVDLVSAHFERSVGEDPHQWEEVVQALRIHYMPPVDERAMPLERREALIRAIDTRLLAAARDKAPEHRALRRLNRNEFAATLNDLLLIDFPAERRLPADDSGYGFDNNADVLTVSPLLMEKYLDVAAEAAEWAVPLPRPPRQWLFAGNEFKGGSDNHETAKGIYSEGEGQGAKLSLPLPAAGEYTATLYLTGDQAGDEVVRAKVFSTGSEMLLADVPAHRDDKPTEFSWTFRIDKPGDFNLRVELANDYYRENDPPPRDRNLYVNSVSISGPVRTEAQMMTPFIERHFGANFDQARPEVIRAGIHRFASRAYRRPVSGDEANSLWIIYQEQLKRTGSSREALHAVMDAVLASPNFIFRHEPRQSADDYALASWLSYALWGTMPDDALFERARQRELRKNLDAEIDRMLQDPRSRALTENFAAQWLQFRDLWSLQVDRKTYPDYNNGLRNDMWGESTRFFNDLIRHDRSILRVLDADYTFANRRLAEHYGLSEKPDKGFERVSLAGSGRRGMWSQGAALTVTSHPDRTSPVLRGKFILENLLGMEPPPPPPNIPSLSADKEKPTPADFRDSLVQHRADPNCASCHNILDPLGLTMERFDGIGALRRGETAPPEVLFDGVVIDGPDALTAYLVETRREEFVHTFAEKLATYATGRGLDWRDRAALDRILAETTAADYRFSALVKAIAHEYAPGMPQTTAQLGGD